jgi:sugar lactone lactonase YvrE/mono/diheme cytochrome c family protein
MGRLAITCCVAVTTLGLVRVGAAHHREFSAPPAFALEGPSLGGASPAAPATPAYLTSTRIAAVGDGALVIDADSGVLALIDAAGSTLGQLAIAHDAGLLAYDPTARLAYVADRRGDRIAVVRVGSKLELVTAWKTPAEPYGVALTPDRTTALVTHVADRLIIAYDVATGRERWRAKAAAEPRGIAVSPDGTRALVAHLTTGTIEELALEDRARIHLALPVAIGGEQARGAFAVTFLGSDLAVSPFQRATPVNGSEEEEGGHYGGGEFPPLSHHLAFFGFSGGFSGQRRTASATISVHQPRAVAWDAAHDALYVAGLGTDEIVQIRSASQVDVHAGVNNAVAGKERCGADGLAVAGDGNLLVWCSFTRSVARVTVIDGKGKLAARWTQARGPALAASTLGDAQHLGMVLFHTADSDMSAFGGLACASCHPEGRADGLSWRIHGDTLQTPLLTGRIPNTAPYKWDGSAKDLPASLRGTIDRLGGSGLGKQRIVALAAYLEAMPAVHPPTRDPAAVARGKAVFETIGCSNCHAGPAYTDQALHKLAKSQATMDTPSLLGLAASAPYFHDGSAATLEAVLRDRGAVHGMSEPARTLSAAEAADLIAFLEAL